MFAAMSYHFTIAARKRFGLLLGAVCSLAGAARGGTLLVNGTFDAGAGGWTTLGGTAIIATGELSDNPYARLPDGALTLLYQKAFSPTPQLKLAFDFFTSLMSPQFPSPGAFPDTAFVSILFGANEAAVQPEVFLSGSLLGLFDYDASNGLNALLPGASVAPSPARAGWHRFSALVNVPDGQPWLALTFQNLNGNGTAADSAFLVDNVEMLSIPEPTGTTLLLASSLFCLTCRRRASF
jgi:hypothetical protein